MSYFHLPGITCFMLHVHKTHAFSIQYLESIEYIENHEYVSPTEQDSNLQSMNYSSFI